MTVAQVVGGGAILVAAALVQRPVRGDVRDVGGPDPLVMAGTRE
jgi:hypothetical protein